MAQQNDSEFWQVMVSSTSKDLKNHRTTTETEIKKLNMLPIMMEHMVAAPHPPLQESLDFVDTADIYVGVFANRYGYIPDDSVNNPEKLSITELEYRHALTIGLPVLAFFNKEDILYKTSKEDERNEALNYDKLKNLKNEIGTDYVVGWFDTPQSLANGVSKALKALNDKFEETKIVPGTRRIRELPPKLDFDLIGRTDIVQEVKERLLAGRDVALQGLSGLGTSSIATTIVQDENFLKNFDGVLSLELGIAPNIPNLLGKWCKALHFPQKWIEDNLKDEDARKEVIEKNIADKKMLVFIDEVWPAGNQLNTANVFKLANEDSVYLLTTQSLALANQFATHENTIQVRSLNEDEGLALLDELAPGIAKLIPKEAGKLIRKFHGLPLNLKMIAQELRAAGNDKKELQDTVSDILEEPDEYWEDQNHIFDRTIDALTIAELRTLEILAYLPQSLSRYSMDTATGVTGSKKSIIKKLQRAGYIDRMGGRFGIPLIFIQYLNGRKSDENMVERMKDSSQKMLQFFSELAYTEGAGKRNWRQELENIRETLRLNQAYPKDQERMLQYARLVNGLYYFWKDFGYLEEMVGHLQFVQTNLSKTDYPLDWAETLMNLERANDLLQHKLTTEVKISLEGQTTYRAARIKIEMEMALAFRNKGQGDFEKAKDIWEDALKQIENATFDEGEFKQTEEVKLKERSATAHMNLGGYFFMSGMSAFGQGLSDEANGYFEQARQHLDSAYKIGEEIGDDDIMSQSMITRGAIESDLSQFDEAEKLYHKGLKHAEESGNPLSRAYLLANLGELEARRKNFLSARSYFIKALTLAYRVDEVRLIDDICYNRGDMELAFGNDEADTEKKRESYNKALQFFLKDLSIIEKRNKNDNSLCDVHTKLAEAYEKLDNSELAQEHKNKASKFCRSEG